VRSGGAEGKQNDTRKNQPAARCPNQRGLRHFRESRNSAEVDQSDFDFQKQ
jgi:hypothetical protein